MWPFDTNNQQFYQQYAQGYDTGNYNGFNPLQAIGHIAQFIQGAPTDMQQRIYQQHFEQMPYEQRVAFAQQLPPEYYPDPNNPSSLSQNFLRLGREQPHLLQRIFNHPLLLGGAVGLAGLIAKHMLAHHHHQQPQQYGYNQGYQQDPYYQQNQYLQQEVNQLQREEQDLRRELREEEHQQHHHHHHRPDYY